MSQQGAAGTAGIGHGIRYAIFLDSARTKIWIPRSTEGRQGPGVANTYWWPGDALYGTVFFSGTNTTASTVFNYYGAFHMGYRDNMLTNLAATIRPRPHFDQGSNLEVRYERIPHGELSNPNRKCNQYSGVSSIETRMFAVRANILESCAIDGNPLTMNFISLPYYNGYSNSIWYAQAILVARCTLGTTFSIGLDNGLHYSNTLAQRRMANGSNMIAYNLYQNSYHTIAWGNTTGTTKTGIGNGDLYPEHPPNKHVIYGSIQRPTSILPAGTYRDTVVVTVTY